MSSFLEIEKSRFARRKNARTRIRSYAGKLTWAILAYLSLGFGLAFLGRTLGMFG